MGPLTPLTASCPVLQRLELCALDQRLSPSRSQVGSHPLWTASHGRGRRWTRKPNRSNPHGPPWTPTDTAWTSTDQEVGCSRRPGRAVEIPCSSRGFDVSPCSSKGPSRATFGSHSLDRTSSIREITLANDTQDMCRCDSAIVVSSLLIMLCAIPRGRRSRPGGVLLQRTPGIR
jgi:hypothetical protein